MSATIGARLLRLAGLLLMLSALAMVLGRAPERTVESLVARWAPPPSDFVDLDGQLVHLRDEGPRADPQPIVLLHGVADSLHVWDGWVAALRGSRRVIRIDLPGHGLTGPRADAVYRARDDARFVLRLLDRLQLGPAVLGGHDLGAEVARQVAAQAPQRVGALVLVAAAIAPAAEVPPLQRVAALPGVGRLIEWVLPRELVLMDQRAQVGDPASITGEQIDRRFEMLLREGNRRALAERLAQAGAPAPIPDPALPALILWGGRDRVQPAERARALQSAIAGSTRVEFDDLGHRPHEEDPVRTAAALLDFLRQR